MTRPLILNPWRIPRMAAALALAAGVALGSAPAMAEPGAASKPAQARQAKRAPLGFCATEKSRRSPACAGVPAAAAPGARDSAGPAERSAGDETGKPTVSGQWKASNDRYSTGNGVGSTVDSINRTIPGAPQSVEDTRMGVGAKWKVCILCE